MILVFGRSGLLAGELGRLAQAAGRPMTRLGRAECDLQNEDPRPAIRRLRPAAVVNAAGYTAVDAAEGDEAAARRVNAEAPRRMAEAALEIGAPFVHVSSDYVFDGTKPQPYVESDPRSPLSAYGRTKAEGEALLEPLAAEGPVAVLRASWVLAPFGRNFLAAMVRLGRERDEARVVEDQVGRPTLASDLAQACLAAAEPGSPLRGLLNVAGADDASWADLAEAAFSELERREGRRPRLVRIPTRDYPTPARRPLNCRLDASRYAALSGRRLRPWRETATLCLAELIGPRA